MKHKKVVKNIEQLVLIALISIGGWSVFTGIINLFDLTKISPIWFILAGILIIFSTIKLGLKRA